MSTFKPNRPSLHLPIVLTFSSFKRSDPIPLETTICTENSTTLDTIILPTKHLRIIQFYHGAKVVQYALVIEIPLPHASSQNEDDLFSCDNTSSSSPSAPFSLIFLATRDYSTHQHYAFIVFLALPSNNFVVIFFLSVHHIPCLFLDRTSQSFDLIRGKFHIDSSGLSMYLSPALAAYPSLRVTTTSILVSTLTFSVSC